MEKKSIIKRKNRENTLVKIQIEACDESYRQINKVSFQQNFKVLMCHYKSLNLSSSEPNVLR